MRGAGNTEGGWGKFFAGVALLGIGVYLLLDSVRVVSGGAGLITGFMLDGFGWHGADGQTTSMGILFVPLFVGIVAMAYDVKLAWARWVAGIGLVILIVEILSRIRFFMNVKTSHLVLMLACSAIGLGLILASYRGRGREEPTAEGKSEEK
jgi:hypothetical protein